MSYERYKEILTELDDQSVNLGWYKPISDEDEILLTKEFMSQVKVNRSNKYYELVSFNESKGFEKLNKYWLSEIDELLTEYSVWENAPSESSWLLSVLLKIDEFSEDLKTEILYEINNGFINYSVPSSNHYLVAYYKNFEYVCWFNKIVASLSRLLEYNDLYCIKVLIVKLYEKRLQED